MILVNQRETAIRETASTNLVSIMLVHMPPPTVFISYLCLPLVNILLICVSIWCLLCQYFTSACTLHHT